MLLYLLESPTLDDEQKNMKNDYMYMSYDSASRHYLLVAGAIVNCPIPLLDIKKIVHARMDMG